MSGTPVGLITGASDGIGAEAARRLAGMGWRVIATGRSEAKLAALGESIRASTGTEVETEVADFARFDQVRDLAGRVAARHPRLDLLANNAGMLAGTRATTVDGHETTWQVNHLSPYLLTRLLWDRLDDGSRVVTTASSVYRAGRIDLADPDFQRRRWSPWRAYGASKLANILFTRELAVRLVGPATCFHPGAVRSDLGRDWWPFRLAFLIPGLSVSTERAAGRLLDLATGAAGREYDGAYFEGGRPSRVPVDDGLAARLWEYSAKTVGV